MKISSKLKLATYNCEVIVLLTDDVIKHVNKIYKDHKIDEDFDVEAEGVMLSPSMTHYYIIIDEDCLTHNTIAHEVHHTVVRLLGDRDIFDEETSAWMAGHLSEFIYKFLDKKKLLISHG